MEVRGRPIINTTWSFLLTRPHSHFHWDHTGDPSTFPTSTELVVGPGFQKAFMPGFPSNPDAPIKESDYKGRNVREISFASSNLRIGRFRALDYFEDGSFYLLDSPGVRSYPLTILRAEIRYNPMSLTQLLSACDRPSLCPLPYHCLSTHVHISRW